MDDNANMRARTLSQAPQWTVQTAADGQQALAATARPDLIVSDVMMPRLNGFGLLHALRQAPGTVGLPVILLSARAGEEATVEGRTQGAG
ncbi:response regulator transcription factor [Hymenobacter sp. UV11]|uniref:response regulator transcription factor n=1 Tax=Hymenobacter sp. UV11 TaxID=1849735 RepID=UPI0010E2050D|nr:response regulator [Hymenobacter sp. UV11]TDN35773.1 hypothetical protein A8B98_12010 [Hymenobacter sp. UV11]